MPKLSKKDVGYKTVEVVLALTGWDGTMLPIPSDAAALKKLASVCVELAKSEYDDEPEGVEVKILAYPSGHSASKYTMQVWWSKDGKLQSIMERSGNSITGLCKWFTKTYGEAVEFWSMSLEEREASAEGRVRARRDEY